MHKHFKVKLYAQSLADIIWNGKSQDKKIVDNFVKLLVNSGYIGKSEEILKMAEDVLLSKQGKRKIIFETARKTTGNQKKMLDRFIEEGDVVKEKISPELIAGVKITINDSHQLDVSMQRKLQNIKI
jgi:F0F1-type ATP synthase delta subunit